MVSERIRMAGGSIAFVRNGRIPRVSSLALAISHVRPHPTNRHLDCEHYPDLCRGTCAQLRVRGTHCLVG